MSQALDSGSSAELAPPTRADLIGYLESGCKPKPDWRIGTEHEKFGYHINDHSPLAYDGPDGIEAMLVGMQRFGWAPVEENGKVIALRQDGASISLEPGGQFELSGAPLENVHHTCNEVHTHLAQVKQVAEELGIGFLGLGFSPKWSLDETPVMPKARYKIMRAYMPKVGTLGREMMFRSCTVQVNLDFSSEADMVKKFRVSLALQPLATALFANSPFTEGKPNGFLSYRSQIWTDTDGDRTGMLPFVFEDGFGFEQYADYALDVPMYFVRRKGEYLDATGHTFRQFLDGDLPLLPGEKPRMQDWEDHLTTIFPEVRLKRFLEMRGADGGPWRRLCALPAFWVGLLYESDVLEAAWDLVKDWSAAERDRLRRDVPKLGLNAEIGGRALRDIGSDVLALSRKGLSQRGYLDSAGDDETGFLSALEDIVARGETPAEELLTLFHGTWNGDVDRIFEAFSY